MALPYSFSLFLSSWLIQPGAFATNLSSSSLMAIPVTPAAPGLARSNNKRRCSDASLERQTKYLRPAGHHFDPAHDSSDSEMEDIPARVPVRTGVQLGTNVVGGRRVSKFSAVMRQRPSELKTYRPSTRPLHKPPPPTGMTIRRSGIRCEVIDEYDYKACSLVPDVSPQLIDFDIYARPSKASISLIPLESIRSQWRNMMVALGFVKVGPIDVRMMDFMFWVVLAMVLVVHFKHY